MRRKATNKIWESQKVEVVVPGDSMEILCYDSLPLDRFLIIKTNRQMCLISLRQ